jgi:hypothetical protein
LEADVELETKANEDLMLAHTQSISNSGDEPSLFDQE